MVLLFSLIAAITLRGFSTAEDISNRKSALESAIIVTQNTAEMLKSTRGDFSYTAEKMFGVAGEDGLVIRYDKSGRPSSDNEYFSVIAERIETDDPLVGGAHIRAVYEDEIILEFDVCWQRGDSNED